jgi:P4 family phage/plasmid primase-like protien
MPPLTLKKEESILDNITLTEVIPQEIVNKLIRTKLLKFERVNEYYQLDFIRKNIKNNIIEFTYKKPTHKWGRLISFNSYITLRKEIRHTLAKDLYIDIDIVNCHPTILYQILINNNITCNLLKEYIEERDIKLEQICKTYNVSIDIAKNLFIRLIYGGSINEWIKQNKLIQNESSEIYKYITSFTYELKNISQIIIHNNPILVHDIKKYKESLKKSVWDASYVSYYLQEYEERILQIVYKYLLNNKYIKNNIVSLCYDGIMILKELYTDDLLIKLNNEIKNKTGFDLKFVLKDMNTFYTNEHINKEIICDENESHIPTYDEYITFDNHFKINEYKNFTKLNNHYYHAIYDTSDFYVAELFLYLYPDFFFSSNENIYFFDMYGIYRKDITNPFNICTQNIIYHLDDIMFNINKFDEFDEKNIDKNLDPDIIKEQIKSIKDKKRDLGNKIKYLIKYLSTIKHRKNLLEAIKVKTYVNKLDEFMDETAKHLIGFENGVIDINTKQFRKGEPEDYISITTGYKFFFEKTDKIQRCHNIIRSLWKNNEQSDYFIKKIAYTLTGNKTKQEVNIHTGLGSNGKSLIFDALRNVLGGYYTTMTPDYFTAYEKGQGRANGELANTKSKRIVVVSEPDNNSVFQVNKLKSISGNETISARHLFKSEIYFRPQFTIHILANDIPNLSNPDGGIQRRLKIIDYPFIFCNHSDYFESEHTKLADHNLDTEMKDLKMALFHLLLNYYDPNYEEITEVKEAVNDYMKENNPVKEWLEQNFIKNTGNIDDKISCKELFQMFTDETAKKLSIRIFSTRVQQCGVSATRNTQGMVFTKIKHKEIKKQNINTLFTDESLNNTSNIINDDISEISTLTDEQIIINDDEQTM